MKILATLLFLLPLCACTKEQPKSGPQIASVGTPVKLDGQPAAAVVPPATNKKVCVKGDEKHEFEIKQVGAGCALNSTVAGKVKEETTDTHGIHKCEHKEKHLVSLLTHSGFTCQ